MRREAELSSADPSRGGLRNPQTSAHLPGIDPGPHNGVGPGGIGKAVGKGFFDGTDVVPVVAPPCSTVEITGHQVHLFVKHHCTNRKDKLLAYATFLGVNVTDVQRQNCECFLADGRLSTKRGT